VENKNLSTREAVYLQYRVNRRELRKVLSVALSSRFWSSYTLKV